MVFCKANRSANPLVNYLLDVLGLLDHLGLLDDTLDDGLDLLVL